MGSCVVCGETDCEKIFDRRGVPKSGQFLRSDSEPYAKVDVALYGCRRCGLLWLGATSPPGEIDYTHISRSTSRQLPKYKDKLIKRIADHAGADGLVVEVGANDGSFARLLVEKAGCRRLVAIEPSRVFADSYAGSGVVLVTDYLTGRTASEVREVHGAARVVVCRHTLEHVPDPPGFLSALTALLADGALLVLEVPDSSTLTAGLALHEIWDEHLFYFSEHNLGWLLTRAGLTIVESARHGHLDGHNLVFYASRILRGAPTATAAPQAPLDCRGLARRLEDVARTVYAAGQAWARPVISLGASHPQTNFLSFTGAGAFVDLLVDDDMQKQGKYVPVAGRSPVPVVSMEQAAKAQSGTILLGAFGYPNWIAKVRQQFSGRDVKFVEPYQTYGKQTT